MQYFCAAILFVLALVCMSDKMNFQHSQFVKHDAKLVEHDKNMKEALLHMHDDVEATKKLALDNSKKLDILLNIATNVNAFADVKY